MFCDACRSLIEAGSVLCGTCGAPLGRPESPPRVSDVADAVGQVDGALALAAAPEPALIFDGPACGAHAGMPLVGTCPRCSKQVCVRCAPEAVFDRFTCTDCAGLTAAHQRAPAHATCAVHPEAAAGFICARCGSFGCAGCADPHHEGRCVGCAPAIGTLAGRGARFAANLLDTLAILVIAFPFAVAAIFLDLGEWFSAGYDDAAFAAMLVGMLLAGALQCSAQLHWGQSVGKRLMGIKILRASGAPIGFWRWLFLRNVLLTVMAQFCGIIGLVDAALIFGRDRRCLHDHLADSIVVDVPPPAPKAQAQATQEVCT